MIISGWCNIPAYPSNISHLIASGHDFSPGRLTFTIPHPLKYLYNFFHSHCIHHHHYSSRGPFIFPSSPNAAIDQQTHRSRMQALSLSRSLLSAGHVPLALAEGTEGEPCDGQVNQHFWSRVLASLIVTNGLSLKRFLHLLFIYLSVGLLS